MGTAALAAGAIALAGALLALVFLPAREHSVVVELAPPATVDEALAA